MFANKNSNQFNAAFAARLAVSFIFMLLLLPLSFADLSVSDVSTLPAIIRPGMSGVVVMTVSNTGTGEALGVLIEGPSEAGAINAKGQVYLGDFNTSLSSSVTFPFSVPSTTEAGVYTISLKISWSSSSGARYKYVRLPLVVTNPAILSADAGREAISTTGDFSLPLRISNSGGAARSVRLSLNSTQFFQTGFNPLIISDLDTGSSQNATLGVSLASNVTSGAYSVPMIVYYEDEAGQQTSALVSLRLLVKRQSPQFSVSLLNTEGLSPGQQLQVRLNIKNSGDAAAYSVRLRLGNDSVLTSLGASDAQVGDLAPGESKTIVMESGVNDVTPGFYNSDFLISYKDVHGDEQAQVSVPVGLSVESTSDISVFVTAKPSPVVSGDMHTLSVTVSNTGSAKIKAVAIKMQPSSVFILQEAQDQQFIGGLNADDFSSVQFKVQVADVPDGKYPVNLTLTFKDAYNRESQVSQKVELSVISKASAAKLSGNGSGSQIILLAGAVVVVGGAYLLWRRSHAKKKQSG